MRVSRAGRSDAASWVRLRLESDQHGRFSPTVVECTVPDGAGGITVPGSMIERFWATPGQCGERPVQSLARMRRATPPPVITRSCWNTGARSPSTPTPDGRIGAP